MNIEWLIPIVLSAIAIILLFLLLKVKSKNKEIKDKQEEKAIEQVRGTKSKVKTPKESLDSLNKLAKNFFKSYLKVKGELSYLELSEMLEKKKEGQLSDFCKKMDFYLYSGKEITKQEALEMVNNFILLTKSKKFKAEF